MTPDPAAHLACRCGQVRGRLAGLSRHLVNRVVCYCDDCQAFAHAIGRPDILDAKGGTDVVQVPPSSLTLNEGRDRIAALRLTEKGPYRFHARCCGTPLGNTVGPAIPYIGLHRQALEVMGQDVTALIGPAVGAVYGQFAIGGPPPGSKGLPVRILVPAVARVALWRLTGRTWPHPFFDRTTRQPTYPVEVLPKDRREALRVLCGPDPAT
ncbi:MAG: DUF6151 family protein [Geminicoccaceae bacterium]